MEEAVLERLKWTYNSRTPRLFQKKMTVMLNEATKTANYNNDNFVTRVLQQYFDVNATGTPMLYWDPIGPNGLHAFIRWTQWSKLRRS